MCQSPLKIDDMEIACRSCNECLTARKNDWVARAMAESNMHQNMMVLMLSYNNETQENRDGSKVFNYSHVSSFLKRVRRQLEYRTNKTGTIRFLCAGENGSKNDRAHWHIIIFTDYDLTELGKWNIFHPKYGGKKGDKQTNRDHKFNVDITWSLWPHGFIHMQQSNQGGVSYVLKYVFKDQFSHLKSKGTMREHQSEAFAASYFRMSKQPPIGYTWLKKELQELLEKRSVVTSLQLKVPNYSGYWYPKGKAREYLCGALYYINQEVIKQTGHPAPQWSTLIHSVVDQQKEREILTYGKVIDEQTPEELEEQAEIERIKAIDKKERIIKSRYKATQKRCGSFEVCKTCSDWFNPEETERYKKWKSRIGVKYRRFYNLFDTEEKVIYWYDVIAKGKCGKGKEAHGRPPSFETYLNFYYRGVNPFCSRKHEKAIKDAFPTRWKTFGRQK